MIKSFNLLIFLEKINLSNRFSIRYFINSSHHFNFYHCNASFIYFSKNIFVMFALCASLIKLFVCDALSIQRVTASTVDH